MHQYSSYKKSISEQFHQDSTETLMVKLYEGMISRIKQSRERFEAGHNVQAKELIIKSMRIAEALMENINFEDGGQTAQNLEKLYFYIISELSTATREEKPIPALDRAQQILEILLKGWQGLEEKMNKDK